MAVTDTYPHDVLRVIQNPYAGNSVSHATLATEALLTKFGKALRYLVRLNPELASNEAHAKLCDEAQEWLDVNYSIDNGLDREGEPAAHLNDLPEFQEKGANLADEMQAALEDFCPVGYYFGTPEGDGADFGFWIIQPDDHAHAVETYHELLATARQQLQHILTLSEFQDGAANAIYPGAENSLQQLVSSIEILESGS